MNPLKTGIERQTKGMITSGLAKPNKMNPLKTGIERISLLKPIGPIKPSNKMNPLKTGIERSLEGDYSDLPLVYD